MNSRAPNRRTLTVNSPTSSRVRIVHSKLSSSASGIIVSHCPEISKSYRQMRISHTLSQIATESKEIINKKTPRTACENSLIRPFDITGLSLL